MKTKAQMNWEVGKEQEQRVLNGEDIDLSELKDIFYQIRQNEYRRGKEDAKKEFLNRIDNLKYTGWVSKDILYDGNYPDEDICICDIEELKKELSK